MKKLITIAWSISVEVEIPTQFEKFANADNIEDYDSPREFQEIISKAVSNASEGINWKDGVITDVQDVETAPE